MGIHLQAPVCRHVSRHVCRQEIDCKFFNYCRKSETRWPTLNLSNGADLPQSYTVRLNTLKKISSHLNASERHSNSQLSITGTSITPTCQKLTFLVSSLYSVLKEEIFTLMPNFQHKNSIKIQTDTESMTSCWWKLVSLHWAWEFKELDFRSRVQVEAMD